MARKSKEPSSDDDEIADLEPAPALAPDELLPNNVAKATLCRLVTIQGDVRTIRGDVRDLKRTVYGNGDPGLKLTVDRISQWVGIRQWAERAAIQIVIVAVLGVIGWVFVQFARRSM